MSSFPKPPTINRRAVGTTDGTDAAPISPALATSHIPHYGNPHTYAAPPVIPPLPTPEITTVNGKLSENETSIILKSTLLAEHQEDPNVLRFISSFLKCRSPSQAAREAGLQPSAGYNLRNRPDIHLAITKLTEKSVMKYGFDATEVVERVKEISNVDPIEFENPDGTFKLHMKDIAPESRRAIKKFKAKNFYEKDPNGMDRLAGQIIEVEMWDKMKSLELLGREKDLFKETKKVEHDVTKNMAAVLLDSRRRAEDHLRETSETIDVTPAQITGGISDGNSGSEDTGS